MKKNEKNRNRTGLLRTAERFQLTNMWNEKEDKNEIKLPGSTEAKPRGKVLIYTRKF